MIKRKGINGRKKGHDFERQIAKVISKWTNMVIARSPQSGGWNSQGDITPKKPEDMVKFPFNMELKKREKWNFSELITGYKAEAGILSWWKQCLRDAKISKRIPVLIFTKNNDKIYCCLDKEAFIKIGLNKKKINNFKYKNLRFFLLDELLSIKYETVYKRLK